MRRLVFRLLMWWWHRQIRRMQKGMARVEVAGYEGAGAMARLRLAADEAKRPRRRWLADRL